MAEDNATASSTNSAASGEVDNSKKNARDRDDRTLTLGDQGGSEQDSEITRKIRRAITSGTNHFSMQAQNVKIITQNGKVTLRGPVKTEQEKGNFAAIAKAQGGTEVDDQTEVKGSSK